MIFIFHINILPKRPFTFVSMHFRDRSEEIFSESSVLFGYVAILFLLTICFSEIT